MHDRTTVPVEKISGGQRTEQTDTVVHEAAFTLFLNGNELATIICSPFHLEELCLGFLYAEGIIHSADEVTGFAYPDDDEDTSLWVEISNPSKQTTGALKRHITYYCSRDLNHYYSRNDAGIEPVESELRVAAADIARQLTDLEQLDELFTATGGAHGAAISDGKSILAFFEDVGRHNALDKLAGWCLKHKVSGAGKMLLFSGRVPSEILLKTAKLGIPLIAARSAPTDMALELADQLNITVVGFVRGQRMNIYTHGQRVI